MSRHIKMTLFPLRIALCICVLGMTAVRPGPDPASASDAPTGRALLIGINTYLSRNVPALKGAVNDVEIMEQILATRFGFPRLQIRTLVDEEATRAGILSAFQEFAEQAGPEDLLYIHFSGHGSQLKDLNGDEVDGMDETIVPFDGRTGDIRDITDDEIGGMLERLKSPNLLIVLDACHSGTATRSTSISARSIPSDRRVELYPNAGAGKRGAVPLLAERYVLMTGAASNQRALDGPVEGRYCGLFSYALARTLESASQSISPREILSGVEKELERLKAQLGISVMPDPQLEAPEPRWNRPVFPLPSFTGQAGDTGPKWGGASRAWLEVRTAGPDRVLLMNGLSMDALPGSIWSVYPPGETVFPRGGAVAAARVTGSRGKDAIARIDPPGKALADSSRAVLIVPPLAVQAIPIRVVSTHKDRLDRLLKSLEKRLPAVAAVGPDDFARYVLELDDDSCWVKGAGGLVDVAAIPASDDNRLISELATLFAKSITSAGLLAMRNPFSALDLEVRVVLAGERARQRQGQRGIRVAGRAGAPEFRIRRDGEPRSRENSIQLEVRSSADTYLTIVDVDAQGKVNLLFPFEGQSKTFCPEGKVRPNEAVLIPDSLEPHNRANFYWDCTTPAGTDTIQVFSTASLATARLIRRHITDVAAQIAGVAEPQQPSLMTELQRELARLAVTRDMKVEPLEPENATGPSGRPGADPGDWTTASVSIIVR